MIAIFCQMPVTTHQEQQEIIHIVLLTCVFVLPSAYLPPQLRVPTAAKPGVTVNFRKLFLNRVQANFENMARNGCEIFRQKQEMVDAITKVAHPSLQTHCRLHYRPTF